MDFQFLDEFSKSCRSAEILSSVVRNRQCRHSLYSSISAMLVGNEDDRVFRIPNLNRKIKYCPATMAELWQLLQCYRKFAVFLLVVESQRPGVCRGIGTEPDIMKKGQLFCISYRPASLFPNQCDLLSMRCHLNIPPESEKGKAAPSCSTSPYRESVLTFARMVRSLSLLISSVSVFRVSKGVSSIPSFRRSYSPSKYASSLKSWISLK